jgi:hypothetical protein
LLFLPNSPLDIIGGLTGFWSGLSTSISSPRLQAKHVDCLGPSTRRQCNSRDQHEVDDTMGPIREAISIADYGRPARTNGADPAL